MRAAIAASPAPVVALSPFVGGRAVKGPTDSFCQFAGIELSAGGITAVYAGLLDGIVADEPAGDLPTLQTDTLLNTPAARGRLAEATLEFAASLKS
jgi:LPPG:FO 2-phospho-L-lactate transferase